MGGYSSRSRCAAGLALLGPLMTTGCTVSFNGEVNPDKTPHAKDPVDKDGVELWDLRRPPSAADVGMPADEDSVAYETRKSRRVRFLLPKGKVLETKI